MGNLFSFENRRNEHYRRQVSNLEEKVRVLEQQQREYFGCNAQSYAPKSAHPTLMKETLAHFSAALSSCSLDLGKLFDSQGTYQGVVNLIVGPDVMFERPNHRKFALQRLICQALFQYFEIESYETEYLEELQRSKESFRKFELLRKITNEAEIWQNSAVAERESILETEFNSWLSEHQVGHIVFATSHLRQQFLLLVKLSMQLHSLAFSFSPPASIFRVGHGRPIDQAYMEDVLEGDGSHKAVGFMIQPGFRLRNIAYRCTIYPKISQENEGSGN